MSGIDGIKSCLENYILLFAFDVYIYVGSYTLYENCLLGLFGYKQISNKTI